MEREGIQPWIQLATSNTRLQYFTCFTLHVHVLELVHGNRDTPVLGSGHRTAPRISHVASAISNLRHRRQQKRLQTPRSAAASPQKLSAPPPLLLLYSPPPPRHCGRAKRPGLIILPATETAVVPHLSHQRLVLLPACSLIYQRPALLPVGGAGETMMLAESSERSKRAVKTLPVPQSCG